MQNAVTMSSTDLTMLQAEHDLLEQRLELLKNRKSHSPEERYEIQVIKKRKLSIKDRMRTLA